MSITVVRVEDLAMARVLLTALRAHGFHPIESGDAGLPGVTPVFGEKGIPINLPEEEARDGQLLAEALLADMRAR